MESPGHLAARASSIAFLFYSTFEELSSFQIASLARPAFKIRTENWHSMDCALCAFQYDRSIFSPARIFHELLSRDHEDGCATWQPQGVGSEAYLNGTSQGPTPEDARKDGHIRGRSKLFMKYPG